MRPLPLLLALTLLTPSLGCATARRHPGEARFLAVSAVDSVTSWAASERGGSERNPLYAGNDGVTIAVTSFLVSVAVTLAIRHATRKMPPRSRKNLWFTATSLRGLGIPFNLNVISKAEKDEP